MNQKASLLMSLLFLAILNLANARIIPFTNFEKSARVVDRLLDAHKIKGEDYSILRQNMIYNMANFLSNRDLYLAPIWKIEQLEAKIAEPNFWAEKIQRDLNVPYKNQAVGERFNKIQAEVQNFLKYLNFVNKNNSPVQIYVFGSIAKGRFGANSDIDLYLDSADKELLRKLELGIYKGRHPSFTGNLEIFTSFFKPTNILDPLIPISLRELRDLKSFYNKNLNDIGFKLVDSKDTFAVIQLPVPPKMHIEFNPIEDRVFYLTVKAEELTQQISEQFFAFTTNSPIAEQTASKLRFALNKLIRDFKEVESDLNLIFENKPSARLHQIRKVIEINSFTKMKQEGMVEYMLDIIKQQILELERSYEIIKE